MSQPTLIAKILPRAGKAIMGKDKSKARISPARLIDQWDEIIAPEDPMMIRPVRVAWRKTGEGDRREGTLCIAAPSALATKLKFQEAIIVSRVNRLFGCPENARITRIAVSHERLAAPPLKRSYRPKVPVAPETQSVVEGIEDPVLREKLQNLAAAMASSTSK